MSWKPASPFAPTAPPGRPPFEPDALWTHILHLLFATTAQAILARAGTSLVVDPYRPACSVNTYVLVGLKLGCLVFAASLAMANFNASSNTFLVASCSLPPIAPLTAP